MRGKFLDTKECDSVNGIANLCLSIPTKVIQNDILQSTSQSSFLKFLSRHEKTMLVRVLWEADIKMGLNVLGL